MDSIHDFLEKLDKCDLYAGNKIVVLRDFILPRLKWQLGVQDSTIEGRKAAQRAFNKAIRDSLKLPPSTAVEPLVALMGFYTIESHYLMGTALRYLRVEKTGTIQDKIFKTMTEKTAGPYNLFKELKKCPNKSQRDKLLSKTAWEQSLTEVKKNGEQSELINLHWEDKWSYTAHREWACMARKKKGKDLYNLCRLATSTLPTPARIARWKQRSNKCPHCKEFYGSQGHILNWCKPFSLNKAK
eukprot:gene1364-12507_t